MREWSAASYENRLATSGDFVAKMIQTSGGTMPSIPELRLMAVDFERGMARANTDGVADDQPASQVAAMIWVLSHKR